MDRRRLIRGLTTERLWALVLLEQSLDDLLAGARPTGTFLSAPDRNTFRADPFPVRDADGQLWVFVEEYRRAGAAWGRSSRCGSATAPSWSAGRC